MEHRSTNSLSISEWVSSSFGSDGNKTSVGTKRKRLKKKPSEQHKKLDNVTHKQSSPLTIGVELESSLWSDKYSPLTASELAVHKKKVSEVQQWMEWSVQAPGGVCLLTGPAGCGKTATVKALSKDMKCDIIEWVNPTTMASGTNLVTQQDSYGSNYYQPSQTKQFCDFLNTADRYPSLQLEGDPSNGIAAKKIVLVEEIPNVFLRDTSRFHEVLRKHLRHCRYPVIFIITDGPHSPVAKLFPKQLMTSLDIHTISFNPVSHTGLMKLAQTVMKAECVSGESGRGRFVAPNKSVVEALVAGSNGDVRSLLNSLQFACLKDYSQTGGKLAAKRSASHKGRGKAPASDEGVAPTTVCGSRDAPLFLFKSLGKILYCKRAASSEEGQTRPQLLVNPEEVLEDTHISSSMFILYLHQNYMSFFSEVDQLAVGSEYLSDADFLSSSWSENAVTREIMMSCSSSVATRGIMYSNYPRLIATGNKWRPLHKPQWLEIHRNYLDNCAAVRDVFLHLNISSHAHLWTPVELQTEILPYTALLSAVTLKNPAQVSILQSVTQFTNSHYYRSRPELLSDKDCTGLDNDYSQVVGTGSQPTTPDDYTEQSIMSQQPADNDNVQHTLSQDTSVGVGGSDDEIEQFEDDDSW